jgi:hypothetical protein
LIHKLYELYKTVYQAIQKFPKKDKFTIGIKIENILLEIIELTLLAYTKEGASKLLIINKIDIKMRMLKLFVRISSDVKSMATDKYIEIEERILEIGKIIGGWIKSCTKSNL